MKSLLFLECGPFGHGSVVAQQVLNVLQEPQAGAEERRIVTRCLSDPPLPPISAPYSQAVTCGAPCDDPALAVSEQLICELDACDKLLIVTPMHNFTMPAALKLWMDYVLRNARTFIQTPEGKAGRLQDRPVLVVVRSGGHCTGERARQPDFLTPWLQHALCTMGISNVQFTYLAGPHPSNESLCQLRAKLSAFITAVCADR